MRRRALLAASAASGGGDQGWAYELHLTPEWEEAMFPWEPDYASVPGDFSEVYQFLVDMCITLGNRYEGSVNMYELGNIPDECNITVDGERLDFLVANVDNQYLDVGFGVDCAGTLTPDYLYLNKYNT